MLIKDIGIIGTGTTPSMKIISYYDSNDIPFIKPSDLKDSGLTDTHNCEFYISQNAKKVARIFPSNTVLCTCIGSIGKIGITKRESSCNQQINYIIPNKEHDARYIGYSLLAIKNKMIRIGSDGTVVPIINKSKFEELEIVTHDLKTETSIRKELDRINNAINIKSNELLSLDELIKSRFIEMFGDPISNEKGWKVMDLNDVTDVRDGTHDSPKYYDSGYPFVTSKNLIDGNIDFSTCQLICKEDYLHFNDRSCVNDGDILMPMIGTIGGAIIVKKDRDFAIKNVALIKFCKDDSIINRKFVLNILNSDSMNEYFNNVKKGGTQNFISLGLIRKIPTIVPPIQLQNEFAQFVEQIDKSKLIVQKEIDVLQELLDKKMEEYFG